MGLFNPELALASQAPTPAKERAGR